MHILYNLGIRTYCLIIGLAALFSRKAQLWSKGRRGFFGRWKGFDSGGRRVIWFHCASLGEFEQGRPVIEEVRRRDPDIFILLTFFSPSGYEIRKDYAHADAVCYLPADTPGNARRFVRTFRPAMAVFVKYEFWYNYISELNKRGIPLYLISANFRPGQIFFKWYGRWFAGMLRMFTHIFVQGKESASLLSSAVIEEVTVSGDTRFDRVVSIAGAGRNIKEAETFTSGAFAVVAGSTWPPDHSLWVRYMNLTDNNIKLIVAPHEIDENEISRLEEGFKLPVARFSRSASSDLRSARIMIIDNIGMLSSLYAYGSLAYIGGGFGKNIHNVLEACVFNIPAIFGPKYRSFREAVGLVSIGGAFAVSSYEGFAKKVDELFAGPDLLQYAGEKAGGYVRSETGATRIIVDKILIS